MQKYKITYFAPYTSANFECQAESIEAARAARELSHKENGYSVDNRNIRAEKFNGKSFY